MFNALRSAFFGDAKDKKNKDTSAVLPPAEFVHTGDCSTCDAPCRNADHPQLPAAVARKIDTSSLQGSVKSYRRQLVVCTGPGTSTRWPSHLEPGKHDEVDSSAFVDPDLQNQDDNDHEGNAENPQNLASSLVEAVKNAESVTGHRVGVIACDRNTLSKSNSGNSKGADILVFPEYVVLKNVQLRESTLASAASSWYLEKVIEQVVKTDGGNLGSWKSKASGSASDDDASVGVQLPEGVERLTERSIILICGHARRDKRCGVAGPMLAQAFDDALAKRGLHDQVGVYLTSHYGGHKFAGNVIIYPAGDWYGRVKTCDVDTLIDVCILSGKVAEKLWRGRIDHSEFSHHIYPGDW